MNTGNRFAILVLCLGAMLGCGEKAPVVTEQPVDISKVPLTLEVWNSIEEGPEKYDPELIQRLRKEEPKFRENKEWKAFYKDVVLPNVNNIIGRGNNSSNS